MYPSLGCDVECAKSAAGANILGYFFAPKFGSVKVSRYTGVSQLQLRVSRYTVQLSPKRTFLIKWYFWGGGVRIVGAKAKGKIRTTPSFALAVLIVDFVGVVRGFRGLSTTPHT